jgi:hypothetical protein
MIMIAGVILGAVIGVAMARRRGGSRLDMVQHAAVMALIFGVGGAALTMIAQRML